MLLWNIVNQPSQITSIDIATRLTDKLYTTTADCLARSRIYLGTLLGKDYRGDFPPLTSAEWTQSAEELRGRPLWALRKQLASMVLAFIAHPESTAADRAAYLDLAKRLGVTPELSEQATSNHRR